MRTLVMVVVVGLVAGCAKRIEFPHVEVPNTPEGLACQRECLLVFHTCHAGSAKNFDVCRLEQLRCLRTCPGASQDDLPVELGDETRY